MCFALSACAHGSARLALNPSPSPLPIATGDYPVYGHATDFSWIAGRVEHSIDCTYLVFDPARRGPWAGRLPVVDIAGLTQGLPSGDTVVVKGDFDRLGAGLCGSPAYAVRVVEEH
jgi:hypothetical protein